MYIKSLVDSQGWGDNACLPILASEKAKYEPHHKNLSLGVLTRSDTNLDVQPQKMIRGLKFRIKKVGVTIYVVKAKALISW